VVSRINSAQSPFQISTNRFLGVEAVSLNNAVRFPDGDSKRPTIVSERSTGADNQNFDLVEADKFVDNSAGMPISWINVRLVLFT
jgi:hypothetical protein